MDNEIKSTIYNVSNILKSSFPYEEYSDICVYCVFIKYILDNEKLPYNKTTFALQKMFDRAELNSDILINASKYIEEFYGFPQSSLIDFAQTYIRFSEMQKSYDVSSKVLDTLKAVTFENCGLEIVEALKLMFYATSSKFSRLMCEKVTSPPLSYLIKELICIKDGDCYADLAFGIGTSTLEITSDKNCSITGYEINRSSIAVAEMLLIISGKEKFNLVLEDVLEADIKKNSFDKIVTIPSIGVKSEVSESIYNGILKPFDLPANLKNKHINLDLILLLKSLLALKNNGSTIMAITPNFLFSNTLIDKKIRKLIVKDYLKAVIQLPNLYYGTGISTVILVLTKKKKTDKVLFIDASTNEYFNFSDKSNKSISNLTETGIDKIKEIFENKKSIEGISYLATKEEIESNDFLLTMSKYIKVKSNRIKVSNKEIDKRLKKLYSDLKEILYEEKL